MKILFVAFVLSFTFSHLSLAGDSYTRDLQAKGLLHGNYKQCVDIENKLGQLFFIFTDGVGTNPPTAIHNEYIKVIKDLNIGGIRLGTDGNQTFTLESARASIKKIRAAATTPVLVSADFGYLDAKTDVSYKSFGLGTRAGFLYDAGNFSKSCIEKRSYLQAFLHSAINVNVALGPVIDPSNKDKKMPNYWGFLSTARPEKVAELAKPFVDNFTHFGVATTLKHFPYTPVFMDPHKNNGNIPDPMEKVKENVRAFKILNENTVRPDFVMTTHLYNSNVDDGIATISSKWIKMRKSDVGFKGIIVSDGMNMLGAFKSSERELFLSKWKGSSFKGISDTGMLSALAVLAGHDMIFIDGDSRETKKTFKELHGVACQDDLTGTELRKRIYESYGKIISYKTVNSEKILKDNNVSPTLAREAFKVFLDMGNAEDESCQEDNFKALKIKIESSLLQQRPTQSIDRRTGSI